MKLIKNTGLKKIISYIIYRIAITFYKLLYLSPLQIIFLRFFGAKIGKNVFLESNIIFYNLYTNGFKNLIIGDNVYIGPNCIFDLANKIIFGDNVTVAAGVSFITHTNVGYKDHYLQSKFPRIDKAIEVKENSFISVDSTILNGVTIEQNNFIGAKSLVNKSTEPNNVYYGIPIKRIKEI